MSGERRYRAYLLSADDRIRSVQPIEAADDASACLEAEGLLQQTEFAAVEVWENRRLIWRSDQDKHAA
jgi:hypothetical protein